MFDDDDDTTNPFEISASDPYDYDFQPSSKDKGVSSASFMDEESMRLKIQELNRREEQLDRREQELTDHQQQGILSPEQQLQRGPKPNFPACWPVVHHSIMSIENNHRRITCFLGFFAWILISITSLLNVVTAVATIFSAETGSMSTLHKVQYIFFSVILALVTSPMHFILGYWPLYQAMRTVGIGRMLLFFFLYIFGILFSSFGMSGWFPYGVSGIITTIICTPQFLGGTGLIVGFVLNLTMCILWFTLALLFVVIFINAIVIFRRQNHTFQKVKDYAGGQLRRGVGSAVSTAVHAGASDNVI